VLPEALHPDGGAIHRTSGSIARKHTKSSVITGNTATAEQRRDIVFGGKGAWTMKVVRVQVDITLPSRMDDDAVTDAVDHMLDAGAADMAVKVCKDALPPVIHQAIAEDCVHMDVGDAKVVESLENQQDAIMATPTRVN
jgi:hypothetical protein